jgi:hypothetical protein
MRPVTRIGRPASRRDRFTNGTRYAKSHRFLMVLPGEMVITGGNTSGAVDVELYGDCGCSEETDLALPGPAGAREGSGPQSG